MTDTTYFRTTFQDAKGAQRTQRTVADLAMDLGRLSISLGRPVVVEAGDVTAFTFPDRSQVRVAGIKASELRQAFKDLSEIAINRPCTRCGGDGIYKWGTILNGVPTHQGTCYRCNGRGIDPVPNRVPVAPEVEVAVEAETESVTVADGTYTLEYADGTHKTYRIRTGEFKGQERRFVELLTGSDNERSFTAFAYLNEGTRTTVNVWKRFERGTMVPFAREIEASLTKEGLATAGLAYALKSGRCCRCGRTLTVPASIHRGMGPDCAAKG